MSCCERCLAPASAGALAPWGPFRELMCESCRDATTVASSSSSSAPVVQRRPYTPPRIDESGTFGREYPRTLDND